MSLAHSPRIVTDGLVFAYDTANTQKSWKGAPTTNLALYTDYSNKSFNTLYDIGGFGGDDADVYYYSSGGYNNLPYKKMIKHTSGTGGSFITEHGFFTLEEGKTYTISCYMKSNKSSVTVSGHTLALNRNVDNAYRVPADINLSDTWQRKTWTYTCAVGEGGTTYQFRQIVYNDVDLPLEVYWSGMQINEGTIAPPYVNGIRANTEAIVDLTNTNIITVNSLTYAGDNTFSFNGTSDYCVLQDQAIPIQSTSYTIETWIKLSVQNINHGIIGDLQFDWQTFHVNSSNKLVSQHRRLSDNVINVVTSINSISTNWTHVAVVFDITAGKRLYINGALDNSNTDTTEFTFISNNRGPKYLGRSHPSSFDSSPRFFNGKIDNFKAYTRALSTQEIQQNFIATRSRYGL